MPFLANGKRVDVMANALGIVNRTNPSQLYELSTNFVCDRVVEKMRTMTKMSEKEALLFDIVGRFNEEQAKAMKKYYKNLGRTGKKEFMGTVETYGIHIKNYVMWEPKPIFEVLSEIYRDYDWIKPIDVYINKFGRKIKIMKPLVVGELYMIKLKQTSKKGFSARATGALSKKGVPDKSFKNKSNQDLYSTTPIRIGIDENLNSNIGASSDMVAKLHLFYRSSVLGRRDLGTELASSIKPIDDFNTKSAFKNRNVEILQAYLKFMGVKIKFMDKPYEIDIDYGQTRTFKLKDGTEFVGTKEEYKKFKRRKKIEKKYAKSHIYVGTKDEYTKIIDREVYLDELDRNHSIVVDIPGL